MLALTLTGCAAKKPVLIPEGVQLRIRYNPDTCKHEADMSVTCKNANFSPQTVSAK